MGASNRLWRAAIIVSVIGLIVSVSMVVPGIPGEAKEETPLAFVLQALPHIDTPWKALSLAFFTTMLTFMNFMTLAARLRVGPLVQIFLLGLAVLTLFSPTVRRSRLVRTGTGLVVLGVVPLMIAGIFDNNPLGFGFLFAFLTPVGGLLIVSGAIAALVGGQSPNRGESAPANAGGI